MTAAAHEPARIVHLALGHGMTYVRRDQEGYEVRMEEKQVKALRRKARQLGLGVVEKAPGGVPTATAAPVQGKKRKGNRRLARRAEGRSGEERRTTAGRTGQWLWRERVRAAERQEG